jgi:NADPH-dependent ferric siderophore reductase
MPAESAKGRLSGVLRRIFMRRATVSACETIAERFHLITLDGPALRGVTWAPGQKVQIAMAAPFVTRTYTPIEWNASAGQTRILCYAHAGGPGSAWVREVKPGDECDIFGPRNSIDLHPTSGQVAVFGDETSIGLAYALSAQHPTRSTALNFELDDVKAGSEVLKHLNLTGFTLFEKHMDDAHIKRMQAALPSPAAAGASFVLTGKAETVQRLRQGLKQLEVPTPRITAKAYWAPGKAGLD